MNEQRRKREEDEIRSIGVKTPTAQTDKLPYRQTNVGQEEVNQQPGTSTPAYNLKMPQQTQFFANKPLMFKSRYINDNGRWTQNAVNDGFVDIKDYIGDIKNDEQGISFNGKEMKISEDFQPEKKVEDYQLKDAKQDNTEYASWWEDTKKGVTETVEKGIDYVNEGQKEAQRKVWRYGAQKLLREKMGCETSAWMLEHALQDNPSDVWRGNDSRIAYLVNTSKEYLSKLDSLLAKSRNGYIDDTISVRFTSKKDPDLYYSIRRADIDVKGFKRDDGKWIIKANFEDKYDFTEIMTFMGDNKYEFSTDVGLGTIANDVAFFSQKLGAVNPYYIYVEFYTTR